MKQREEHKFLLLCTDLLDHFKINPRITNPINKKSLSTFQMFNSYSFTQRLLKRKNIVGYNVNGVKQPTVFFPFEVVVRSLLDSLAYHLLNRELMVN